MHERHEKFVTKSPGTENFRISGHSFDVFLYVNKTKSFPGRHKQSVETIAQKDLSRFMWSIKNFFFFYQPQRENVFRFKLYVLADKKFITEGTRDMQ